MTYISGAVGQHSAALSVQIAVYPITITQRAIDILKRAVTVALAVGPCPVIAAAIGEIEVSLSFPFAFLPGAAVSVAIRTGQLSQTGSFLWDVYNGDADPQGVEDWYTGIHTGRIGK